MNKGKVKVSYTGKVVTRNSFDDLLLCCFDNVTDTFQNWLNIFFVLSILYLNSFD